VEQYEARFKTPLGAEWNSRAIHQKETMPRVTKKVCLFMLWSREDRADYIAWSYHRACQEVVLVSPLFSGLMPFSFTAFVISLL
jgi:hypothetical protein